MCVLHLEKSISMDSPGYFVERYRTRFPGLNTGVLGCCPRTNMRGKTTRHWLWTSFWTHPHCQLWGGQSRWALLDQSLKHPASPASNSFRLNDSWVDEKTMCKALFWDWKIFYCSIVAPRLTTALVKELSWIAAYQTRGDKWALPTGKSQGQAFTAPIKFNCSNTAEFCISLITKRQ